MRHNSPRAQFSMTNAIDAARQRERHREPCYSAKEVAELLGYTSTASLWDAVSKGRVPRPAFVARFNYRNGNKAFWPKSAINALAKEKSK